MWKLEEIELFRRIYSYESFLLLQSESITSCVSSLKFSYMFKLEQIELFRSIFSNGNCCYCIVKGQDPTIKFENKMLKIFNAEQFYSIS